MSFPDIGLCHDDEFSRVMQSTDEEIGLGGNLSELYRSVLSDTVKKYRKILSDLGNKPNNIVYNTVYPSV